MSSSTNGYHTYAELSHVHLHSTPMVQGSNPGCYTLLILVAFFCLSFTVSSKAGMPY